MNKSKIPVYEVEVICPSCKNSRIVKTTDPNLKDVKCFECFMGNK